jgi:membrane fusion protein (multidrug efflux system)
VRDAAAAVRSAYLTLSRTELPAPVAGFVARRNVQLGQRVSPGTPLMAVVPLDQVWVDANFKEPQLARMRVGQPVTLSADLYGSRILYHGSVADSAPAPVQPLAAVGAECHRQLDQDRAARRCASHSMHARWPPIRCRLVSP